MIPTAEGPGTVKLVLVDSNGQPANEELVQAVYNYIVSPLDRSVRRLPTACAKLLCSPASTITIDFTIMGLIYEETTSILQIKKDFAETAKQVYLLAKQQNILRYNDMRPILSDLTGVLDFDEFLMNGEMKNILLGKEEYPETGRLDFR